MHWCHEKTHKQKHLITHLFTNILLSQYECGLRVSAVLLRVTAALIICYALVTTNVLKDTSKLAPQLNFPWVHIALTKHKFWSQQNPESPLWG